jgi:TM2 domain-containing membrane protein YozV
MGKKHKSCYQKNRANLMIPTQILLIILAITGWGLFFFSVWGYIQHYKRMTPLIKAYDRAKIVFALKSRRENENDKI